jgi:putative ABC transport system permease protein
MFFTEVILKNLRQRRTRTGLTVAGLAVAVAAITALWNFAWGYAESASKYYAARDVDIVVVRAGVSNRLTSNLPVDRAALLSALPGIEGVEGSLTDMVSLGKESLIGIPLRGLAPDGFAVAQLPISRGRALRPHDHGVVLLGASISESLGKREGQSIDVEGSPFQIVGVFQSSNPFDSNSIVAPLADVQELMDRPGVVSEFQIRAAKSVRDNAALKKLCQAIEAVKDDHHQPLGLKAQPTHEFVSSASEAKLSGAMAWATTAIVLLLSLLGMLNTMLMSVMERTRELGLLRAVGWTRPRVMRMILGECVAISLAAAVLGAAAAWLLNFGLSQWSTTSLFVPPQLSGAALMLGFGAAIVSGVAGAFYPAYHAASLLPVESLRHE